MIPAGNFLQGRPGSGRQPARASATGATSSSWCSTSVGTARPAHQIAHVKQPEGFDLGCCYGRAERRPLECPGVPAACGLARLGANQVDDLPLPPVAHHRPVPPQQRGPRAPVRGAVEYEAPASGRDRRRRTLSRTARRRTARIARCAMSFAAVITAAMSCTRSCVVGSSAAGSDRPVPRLSSRIRRLPRSSARTKLLYPVCCNWMSRCDIRPGTMTRSDRLAPEAW